MNAKKARSPSPCTDLQRTISGLSLDLANHELASSCTHFLGSSNLMDLDEVTAGIIEDGHGCHSHVCWLHRKLHTQLFQSGILFLNVINLKCRERYPVLKQRLFERFHCRVISVWLKKQLGAVQRLWRDNG